MKLFRINSLWTALRALVGWPLLALGVYMVAALAGSLIPVNGNWSAPREGYDIYLYDNGIHTSIIFTRLTDAGYTSSTDDSQPPQELPTIVERIFEGPTDVIMPWQQGQPEKLFPGDPAVYPYLMIGWGDARFYRETPRWSDFRASTALAAVVGSGKTLVHVDRLKRLPKSSIRRIRLTAQEQSRVIWLVKRQLKVATNEPEPQALAGYGSNDRFFEATNEHSYSATFTCNNWVSDVLAKAGVKTGYWTPLPFGVMWWH